MTWVLAGRHFLCVRSVSDVQVTLKYADGNISYHDCVCKTHQIHDRVTVLFADNIRLAFDIIEDLKAAFVNNLDRRLFNEPDLVIEKISRRIRWRFARVARNGESVQFIVMVAPMGAYKSFGLAKICSPDFKIYRPSAAFEMIEIGSGSQVGSYRGIIKKHEMGVYEIPDGKGGFNLVIPLGSVMAQMILYEAATYQEAGISQAMHLTVMTPELIKVVEFNAPGQDTFPVVAETWQELKDLLSKKGVKLGSANALA